MTLVSVWVRPNVRFNFWPSLGARAKLIVYKLRIWLSLLFNNRPHLTKPPADTPAPTQSMAHESTCVCREYALPTSKTIVTRCPNWRLPTKSWWPNRWDIPFYTLSFHSIYQQHVSICLPAMDSNCLRWGRVVARARGLPLDVQSFIEISILAFAQPTITAETSSGDLHATTMDSTDFFAFSFLCSKSVWTRSSCRSGCD